MVCYKANFLLRTIKYSLNYQQGETVNVWSNCFFYCAKMRVISLHAKTTFWTWPKFTQNYIAMQTSQKPQPLYHKVFKRFTQNYSAAYISITATAQPQNSEGSLQTIMLHQSPTPATAQPPPSPTTTPVLPKFSKYLFKINMLHTCPSLQLLYIKFWRCTQNDICCTHLQPLNHHPAHTTFPVLLHTPWR